MTMPLDSAVLASLAYRKNEAAILKGDVPDKYTRLLPFIPGQRILEIGSAEGVLSLLLAKEGREVIALERRRERHEAAVKLWAQWQGISSFDSPTFVHGAIGDRLDLLEGQDTLVAVRVIYYLMDDLDWVFSAAAGHVQNVVLCGNRNRAEWWREGIPNRNDRADNYYASAEGMRDILTRHGYEITRQELQGDPIVVGRRG